MGVGQVELRVGGTLAWPSASASATPAAIECPEPVRIAAPGLLVVVGPVMVQAQ